MNTSLVIGSNSFTGSHFVDYLLEKTDLKVVGVSRSPEYDPAFLPYRYRKEPRANRFTFHQLDVNTQQEALIDLCDQVRPVLVANFAAQGEVRSSWNNPAQWWQTNTMAVVNFTESLRKRAYVERYVTASTPEVYGTTGINVAESHTYRPSTPYAASKLGGDLHLMMLHRRYNFPVVFTRAANVYGPHQQLYRIIPRTAISLKLKKKIDLHGRGESQRAFVHIRDVADATWRAATSGKPGEVYHVSPDNELQTIAGVVRTVCKKLNVNFDGAVNLVAENYGQDAVFSLDASKARRELSWEPKISFDEGIEESLQWVEDNWQLLKSQPLEYVHKP